MSREIRLLALLSNTSKLPNDDKKIMDDTSAISMVFDANEQPNRGDKAFGMGHPNVMRLYDAIDTPKQLYLIMENVQGQML